MCGGANSPLLVSIDSQGGVRRLCLASWHLCAHVVRGPTLKQQVWRCGFGCALAPYSGSVADASWAEYRFNESTGQETNSLDFMVNSFPVCY